MTQFAMVIHCNVYITSLDWLCLASYACPAHEWIVGQSVIDPLPTCTHVTCSQKFVSNKVVLVEGNNAKPCQGVSDFWSCFFH